MITWLRLLIYLLLPFACIRAVPVGRRSPAERLVFGLALYELLLLGVGLALGHAGALRPGPYTSVSGILVAVLLAVGSRLRAASEPTTRWSRARGWLATRRGLAALALASGVALLLGIQLAADAWQGTRQIDGLWYHIPRTVTWMQQGHLGAFPTPVWQQVGLPVGANVVLGGKILLGLGWAGAAWVNALLTVGAIACVYLVGRDLGLGRWRALLAALLFASFPAVGERASSVSSDMAATFPVLAGYLAWTRGRDTRSGLAAFGLLSAVGIACKTTVLPFVLLLGGVAAYRAFRMGRPPRISWQTALAAAMGLALIAGSIGPVYQAFGDLVGGPTGRSHAVQDFRGAVRGVAVNAANWALEPLGYAPAGSREWMRGLVEPVYSALGVRFEADALPASVQDWEPWPSPDAGRTGALSLVAFLVFIPWLPGSARRAALPLFLGGFALISGLFSYQPWSGRFTLTLLAGYALLWASATPFARPRARWWLAVIVGCNLAAALAVTSWLTIRDLRLSRPGGPFHALTLAERHEVARRLDGDPLWVVSGTSPETPLDALLAGPEVAFGFRYLTCPDDGDWAAALDRAATESPGVALAHGGIGELRPASPAPSSPACPTVGLDEFRGLLRAAGWALDVERPHLDLWLHAPAAAPRLAP